MVYSSIGDTDKPSMGNNDSSINIPIYYTDSLEQFSTYSYTEANTITPNFILWAVLPYGILPAWKPL
jgi:hypothetical protein